MAAPLALEPLTSEQDAAIVTLNLLGLGARPGEMDMVAPNLTGWVEAQFGQTADEGEAIAGLPSSEDVIVSALKSYSSSDPIPDSVKRSAAARTYRESAAHIRVLIDTDNPLRERLARFFATELLPPLPPELEASRFAIVREVIRPHMGGYFYDIVTALAHHPALLIATGNHLSIGPTTRIGAKLESPVRTDLAKFLLERLTFGEGNAPSKEVGSLATMLTGWSIRKQDEGQGGRTVFHFRDDWHEAGEKRFLGRIYPDAGSLEGEAAIESLVRNEETARMLSRRIAAHFFGTAIPEGATERIERAYLDNGGKISALAHALVGIATGVGRGQRQIKDDFQYSISALRALGLRSGDTDMARVLSAPLVRYDTVFGNAGTSLKSRILWLETILQNFATAVPDPAGWAHGILGASLSEATIRRLSIALSPIEAMGLTLVSPEFQSQ